MRNIVKAVIFLLLILIAHADIDSPVPPPPQPEAQRIKILVGEKAEITLRARSRVSLPLTFLIRSNPQYGTLSEVKIGDNRSAKIVYTHNAADGPVTDSFTYAVRAFNTAVSAPEKITIQVVEPASDFDAPAFIAFGGVSIGDSSKKKIMLKNLGGGVIKGRLELPLPWKISDEGNYSLLSHQSKEFEVTFTPLESREYREIIAFSHDSQRRISLVGTGLPFLHIEPDTLSFQSGEKGQRHSLLEIVNTSDKLREIEFEVTDRVAPIQKVSLQPGETVKVPILSSLPILNAVTASIKIKSGIFEKDIPITGFALPSKIQFNSDTNLDFGKVTPGHIYRKPFSVKNAGGSPATLHSVLPEGVTLSPDPIKTPIKSAQTVTFEAVMEPKNDSAPPLVISFLNDGIKIQEIFLNFTLEQAPDATVRAPVTSSLKPSAQKPVKEDSLSAAASLFIHPQGWKPRINNIGVKEQGKTNLHLVWRKIDSPDISIYFVEQLLLQKKSTGTKEWAWVRANARITMENDSVNAFVTGLPPGTPINYRILAGDKAEDVTPVSEMFRISTKETKPGYRPSLLMILTVGFLIAVYFIWKERRNQMAILEEETNRIHKR
ncbi:MAG: hypothetical protein ABIP97_09420 [Chthoniobacterales bacterium]